jgi:chaperonin GroES
VSAVKAVKKVNAAPKQKKPINAKAAVVSNNLTPLEDRIIVKVSNAEKVTAGGIIIPETAQVSGNLRGVVVAVGKGKRNKKGVVRPLDVKKGDEVLFSEFVGTKTDLGGQEVCILRESEILGRVE